MAKKTTRRTEQPEEPATQVPSASEDPILSLSDAAKRAGVHRSTMRTYIMMGAIAAGKSPRGLYRLRQSAVDEFLSTYPVGEPPPPE